MGRGEWLGPMRRWWGRHRLGQSCPLGHPRLELTFKNTTASFSGASDVIVVSYPENRWRAVVDEMLCERRRGWLVEKVLDGLIHGGSDCLLWRRRKAPIGEVQHSPKLRKTSRDGAGTMLRKQALLQALANLSNFSTSVRLLS